MRDPHASEWSLLPEAIELVIAAIREGRETAVECGSGASTVAIAGELARRESGRLYSLEHDPRWHAETAARLREAGVGDRVELMLAPVRDGWYDRRALDALPRTIDLLLVDGPPGDLDPGGQSRYPALPALARRLRPGALVILDDIHRAGERRVLERWQRELPIAFELHPEERVAIGVFSAP